MPPARRACLSSRPSCSSTAATDPSRSRGWLSVLRRKPAKRPRQASDAAGDDGTPFSDEILLVIFALLSEIADLVRCAATCRRWRRLVSGDAAFICRVPRWPPCRFVGAMALGFFHHQEDAAAAARFVATASASRRFGLNQLPSLNSLVQGIDGADRLLDSYRVVASRNGLVVVDLRRGKHDRTLKLCVCNPVTGDVHFLPHLADKDGLGQHYACTVVTADDRPYTKRIASDNPPPPRSLSYFRLIIVYRRHDFTAFRSYSYSSDDNGGRWSEEAKVRGVHVSEKQMSMMHNGVVAQGGMAVYWEANGEVLRLRLDTLEAATANLPSQIFAFVNESILLGLTPEGSRLCAVRWRGTGKNPVFKIDFLTCDKRDNINFLTQNRPGRWLQWERTGDIIVDKFSLDATANVKLRWFCEKSGVVFFTAGDWSGNKICEVYALDLHTKKVDKLASHLGKGDPWGNLHGYELGQAAYLASLAEHQGMEEDT